MASRRLRRKIIRLAFVILLGGVMAYLAFGHPIKSRKDLASSVEATNSALIPLPTPADPLATAINTALDGTHGTYGIVVKNLKTGESFELNADRQFESGSLYKLWIMAEAFQQIKDGNLTTDEVLTEDIPTLNSEFNISPDDADLTEGTITLTVADALNQMITISHNYSALLLTKRIKLSTVGQFLQQNGFNQSKLGTEDTQPTTTASDIALFFEKLYKGELADPEYTQKMLDLLKNQQLNNKLPQGLPTGTVIAHKTGELALFTHDAGIVYTPTGDYIIVVLSDSDSPAAAEDRIAGVSKAVYKYFTERR